MRAEHTFKLFYGIPRLGRHNYMLFTIVLVSLRAQWSTAHKSITAFLLQGGFAQCDVFSWRDTLLEM